MQVELDKGNSSYDYVQSPDGLIYPSKEDFYKAPNGLSLFPYCVFIIDILENRPKNTVVTILPKGLKIPDSLVLIHEFGDHFSLQTTSPITPAALNTTMSNFLSPLEVISKAEYFKRMGPWAKAQ